MRILFDHQIFSYQTFGGISRYFFELMNQFQQFDDAGFELALKYSDNVYIRDLEGMPVADVYPAISMSPRVRFLVRYVLNARYSDRRVKRGEYSVFHPTFFDPSFLPFLAGRPFVVTLHDMTPEIFPELFPRRGLYGRFVTGRWIAGMRLLAQKASHVIAVSENTKADAVRIYGIDPSMVSVIHHGSSLDPLASTPVRAVDMVRPFLLFVGGRGGYKNFRRFARAATPLLGSDADLRVVCVGGGGFSDEENKQLQELNVRDRFRQIAATDTELAALYRAARALVFPSQYEGFGIPIVEAFSCACPCVLSNASCFPEIAGDAAAYFDPADENSMTQAIRKVLDDESFRGTLIDRGTERAKLFSWRKTALETLAVYKSALAGAT